MKIIIIASAKVAIANLFSCFNFFHLKCAIDVFILLYYSQIVKLCSISLFITVYSYIIEMVIIVDKIDILIRWIKESKRTVFFGGAGVSTESGLKDFRSKDGIYHESYKYPPEEILSHHFFLEHTKEFYDFYREKLNTSNFYPNVTHIVLSKLEKAGKLSSIITQNIDGFHQIAGSRNVLELHGSIKRNYCMKCHKFYDDKIIFSSSSIPYCTCGGIIKPDVVLYEEVLDEVTIKKAIEEISKAELLIIAGTSLNVYPAASFVHYFCGKHLVLINRDKTPFDNYCDLVIYDSLGNVFKKMEKELM